MPNTASNNPKKPNKTWRIPAWAALAVVAAAIVIAAIVILLSPSANTNPVGEDSLTKVATTKLYFVNNTTNLWETETRPLTMAEKRTDMVSEVLGMLVDGPKATTLTGSVPSPTLIVSGALVEGMKADENGIERENVTVAVTLSDEYNALSSVDSMRCLHAVVYSLTELDFVNDVQFYVGDTEVVRANGQAMGALNRDNMLLGDDPIPPNPLNVQDFIVYFADDQILEMQSERRSAEISQNKPLEQYIVAELLEGPASGMLMRTIPADTKLRSAYLEGDICYVDFSADFINKFDGGSSEERLMVYSIVNSLTEQNVKKVKFLVDGDNITDQGSFHLDMSKPFERDESMIAE